VSKTGITGKSSAKRKLSKGGARVVRSARTGKFLHNKTPAKAGAHGARKGQAGKADPVPNEWSAFDELDDRGIERAVAEDPDAAPTGDDDFWANAKVMMPVAKQAISIRVDEDVLAFFKDTGPGYQSRINAVLRSYMEAKK
jgi:uncharacterized protein (DUF4415 family)